jgi:hypothetical protein
MNKDLKDKAIDIHGKEYVMVKDRVTYFNDTYKNGSITTKIVKSSESEVIIKAVVTPDVENPSRTFSGYATGDRTASSGVDSTNPVENAETSAVGRALAMMGIGVVDSIASGDEVREAQRRGGKLQGPASQKQIDYLESLLTDKGILPDRFYKEKDINPKKLDKEKASKLIKWLKSKDKKSDEVDVEDYFKDM